MGKVRLNCRWLYQLTGKIKHCPIDNGKLLKVFKQKDDLFRNMFLRYSFSALAEGMKGVRVNL